ncbi:hypothetical protein WDU94_006821 [Cyamophila willieti]
MGDKKLHHCYYSSDISGGASASAPPPPFSSTPASPPATIKELENAQKCVDAHSKACVIGIKLEDAILLVARKPATRSLETTKHRVIDKLSDNILISACGFGSDSDHVTRKAQVEVVSLFDSTDTNVQSEQVVSKVSDYLSHFATRPEYRPLGVSVLLAGQNRANRTLNLYLITSGGTRFEYRACCIGCHSSSVMAELEKCSPEIYTSVSVALKCSMGLVQAKGAGSVQVGIIRDGEEAKILNDAEVNALLS